VKLGPKFKRAVLASTDPTKLPEERPARPALTEEHLEPGQQISIKAGEVWITVLGKDKDDNWTYRISDFRNAYMGKTGGLTSIPSKALATRGEDGYEDPVVEPEFQKRITQESRRKQQAALDDMFVALEELRSAVNTRLANNPEARKLMGRDAWALKSKIDAVERRLRRRHAA
jgi:hypothetical protein